MINTYKTTLRHKSQLTDDVYLFHFKLIDPAEINFVAGQYLVLLVPQPDSGTVRRLYSIASPDFQKDSFELIVKIIPEGVAGQYFAKLDIGDTVNFEGPAGRFTTTDNMKEKVFLATGTGIVPVLSILSSVILGSKATPESIDPGQARMTTSYKLLWGLPTYRDVFLLDEFKKLSEENPNFSFKICLSREENPNSIPEEDRKYFSFGRIDKELSLQTPNSEPRTTNFFICGNRDIVEALKGNLYSKKIEDHNMIFEKF